MRFLKTNTATRITVGPFLDKTDGITAEVALTATNEKLTFVVDAVGVPTLIIDANATASGGDNDLVHITNDDAGFYDLELTAAQTNYIGRGILSINYPTDHCPVFHEFMILPAEVFDYLCAAIGTDYMKVDIAQWNGTNVSAPATAGIPDINVKNIDNAAVSTTTAQIGANAVTVDVAAIASTSFAASAIDAAALAVDAGTEIGTAVWATTARTLTAAASFQVKKNTQLPAFPFVMTDSTNHNPATGLAITATRSIDGGVFAACANAVTEIANGWYKITLANTDLNGTTIALRFTAATADDLNITMVTQAQS